MKKLLLTIAFSCALFISLSAQERSKSVPPDFKEFCQKVLDSWNVPGFSVVVVKDGEVVFVDGFGTTALGESGKPVTAETQFVLASTSKAITAGLLATLVDEGLVKWTDTVVNHLPDFKLYDDWITQNYLVQDIMTHKIGLKAYAGDDLPHFGYKRDEIYRIYRHLRPSYPYRTTYAYNNTIFTVSAKIIEKHTGMSWDEALIERLFKPLEMKNSTTGNIAFFTSDNLAKGHMHFRDGDKMKATLRTENESAYRWLSAIAPAGFVVSTAEDMGNWLIMLTQQGKFKEKQFLKPETRAFLTKPQTVVSIDSTGLYNYAQGWRVEHGRQGQITYHTGLAYGYTSLVALVPDIDMGVAVLTNGGSTVNPQATIMRELIEWYRGEDKRDWLQFYIDGYFTPQTPRAPREEIPEPELLKPMKEFTGVFFKEDFGNLTIFEKDSRLHFKLKDVEVPMRYIEEDSFSINVSGAGRLRVDFFRDKNGEVNSVTFEIGDPFGAFMKIDN